MKKKKITQKQRQSLRERSAKPGRLIKKEISKPELQINSATIDYNMWYTWGNKLTCKVDRADCTFIILDDYDPLLLDDNGFRNVNGFVCQSLGINDEDMRKLASSVKSPEYIKEFKSRFNTELAEKTIWKNDLISYSIAGKIGFLIELFNRYKFELYFINLPTYVYNDVEEQYLNRVSTNKGTYVFATMTPMWKTKRIK